jgi:hypothetical protein
MQKVELIIVTLRLAVNCQSVRLGDTPLQTHDYQFVSCGHGPYVTSSPMRVWVCRLQLLWPSPAELFSGPSPAFYCLRLETPPTWKAMSPYLFPPATGWPSYTPRHWVPFSSLPMTRRVTVEVFGPVSTRDRCKDIAYTFLYTVDLHYIAFVTKSALAL